MHDLNHLFHGAGEGSFFPSSRMTFDTEPVSGAPEVCKTDAVTVFRLAVRVKLFGAAHDEMISVAANIHSFREFVLLKEFRETTSRHLLSL